MPNYLCADCNSPIRINQKKCKNCWAELKWEKTFQSISASQYENIRKYQVVPWIMAFSFIILPIFFAILASIIWGWDLITIGVILSLPISVAWLVLVIRNMKRLKAYEKAHEEEFIKKQEKWFKPIGDNHVKCPKCGSKSIYVDKKGYDTSSWCCGFLMCGPLGFLLWQVNANKIRKTCLNCNHSWE